MPNRSAVLLLDEPTAGVDPLSRRDFWRIPYGLRVAIVIATSYLDEAERCTRLGLLRQGRMAYCDAPEALKRLMPGRNHRDFDATGARGPRPRRQRRGR
jgi:ABC-2 type transport system ATP-binding protein